MHTNDLLKFHILFLYSGLKSKYVVRMKTLVVWFPCRSKLSVRSTSPDLTSSLILTLNVGHGLCTTYIALKNCLQLQDAKFPDCFSYFPSRKASVSKALRHIVRLLSEKFMTE